MANPTTEDFGQPDIAFSGFQLWIHGGAPQEFQDYWDGNWLSVTAHCGAMGADVREETDQSDVRSDVTGQLMGVWTVKLQM